MEKKGNVGDKDGVCVCLCEGEKARRGETVIS